MWAIHIRLVALGLDGYDACGCRLRIIATICSAKILEPFSSHISQGSLWGVIFG